MLRSHEFRVNGSSGLDCTFLYRDHTGAWVQCGHRWGHPAHGSRLETVASEIHALEARVSALAAQLAAVASKLEELT